MSTITKRILALVLCFVMLVGVMPVSALAEDTVQETTIATEAAETTAATSEPTETTAPAATSEPTETTAPAESSEPTETTAPAESSEPTGPSVPAEGDTASGEEETEPESRTAFGLTRASTVLDAAIFCSDVHGNPSTVKSVFNGIKSADSTFDPSTASFVGDTDGSTDTVTSNAQSVFSGVECLYAYGSHDSGYVSDVTDLLYGDRSTNYYVYAISQSSMESSNPSTSGFTSTVAGLDKSKPLFIISHMPLHSRRGDNNGAAAWYTAISAAAEQMDIAFFWAHNHTGDNEVDRAAYYVAKDGSETITVEGGSTVTPNFTYLNAGYIDPPNNAARMNVATAVRIYDDSVNYTVYNSGGELSGTYAVNETVTREFASGSSSGETVTKTLSSVAVTTAPTTTTYNVGDTFSADGLVITATYSDGTTAEVTGYTLSEVDMTTPGTQTVTVTYSEGDVTETASFDITVNAVIAEDAVLSSIAVSGKNEYSQGEALALTVIATFDDGTTKTLGAGEYTVSGYDANTAGEQTVTVSYTYGDVTKTAEYTVTVTEAASNDVTVGGTTTTTKTKTVYVLSAGNPSGNVLIADSATAGDVHLVANDGGDLSNTDATVVYGDCDGDGDSEYYIELTDATNELWTVSNSYRFQNNGYYLRYNNGLELSTRNYTTWSYSSNRLSYRSSRTTYYLRYNNGWTTTSSSSSASNIYFYVPTEVEYGETVDTTVKYTMRAENLKQVVDAEHLTAKLDFCLQGNGADLTTLPSGGSYSFAVLSDENGIIDSIGTDGTVTFTGTTGTATVKVAYTWTQDGQTYTVYKNITVEAAEPYYALDITKDENVVTGTTITQKGVTATTTLQLGTQITYSNAEGSTTLDSLPEGATIEWHIPEEYQNIATVGHETGLVTFKGEDGAFYVTATLTVNGKDYTVGVNISATTSSYSVPSDGVSDFPEYPNEGAIRFDKTATAVGNFSETGIAQVELSMTGVPYTTGSEIDVVLMLDMTGSMDDVTSSTSEPTGYVRIDATIAASKAFIETIVKNEDGSYNGNRVGVYVFNKNGAATLYDFGTVDSDTELAAIEADLETIKDDHFASGGTPYDDGLAKCQEVLAAAKTDGIGNNRQQFTVFMTDGVPTSYAYVNGSTYGTHSSASAVAGMLTSSDNYATRDTDYKYEYYSTEMKKAGVTVYSVGVGLNNENNAWSGSAAQCLNLASVLLNDISGPGGETTQPDTAGTATLSKKDQYFFSVEDQDAGTEMTKVFSNIAQKILQAATDVTVEDKITDEYTMIFDIPEGSKDITGVTNDFYIEFGKYALDEDHERTDFTSVTKLYIQNTSGTLSAKDSADPVFEQKTIGEKGTLYYWSTNAADGDAGVSVTVDGTTYYFVSYGMEEAGYNMTSGAYVNGIVDTTTNMSEDLVIATPYFVYNAAKRMIYWTVDKLDTEEYVLRYFLYLDNSATEVGTANETDPGSYPTNDHAYITYTNFNGNDCRQEFPIPQLTWSGAQVSYVFYLVNAQGQPINKSGQVVDFANATFVTDVYTEDTVWNKGADGQITADSKLSIDWLAANLLPADYKVYDEKANYKLHVFGDHTGESIFDYFIISGGTAAEISTSLNERLSNLNTTASTVSVETTKVYNTKAGTKITGYGTYTSEATNSIAGETVLEGFDFYNTTVAFAVVWQPTLVPDVVVVDYGLDVLINVVQNDLMQNTVSGIGLGNDAYGDIAMNNGVSTTAKLGTAALTTNDGSTISIENENVVRFHQNDMTFEEAAVFYYESPVEFYEGSDKQEGYMYSSVTVIPATTIYYEDEFVDLSSYTWSDGWVETDAANTWTQVGTTISATQAQDRPGTSQISADLDADNIYGYDEAYSSCSMYSLGSAMKAHVDYDNYAQAEFSFYGTGFDVISLTSNQTGAIIMEVADKDGNIVRNNTVDTYYGYTQNSDGEWVISENDPNALYQVPVMEIAGLEYGKYTVKIMAVYDVIFDHSQYTTTDAETVEAISAEQYDFYLDAIRIYDPANDGASEEGTVVEEAYEKDKESWPVYEEIRNNVITEAELEGADEVAGIVFIDSADETASVGDYTSYGPNNELYLAPGQAIAFSLNLSGYTMLNESGDTVSSVEAVHVGLKSASSNVPVGYKIFDGGSVATSDDVADVKAESVETATGMYYDITALKDNVIVIYNSGTTGILSLTDVKVTFKQDPSVVENLFYTSAAVIAKLVENMNTPAVTVPTVFTVTTTPTTATAGSRVTVTVTTSADVAAVSVDGTMITTYSVQNGNRIWKFYVSTPDEGSQEIVVNTYNEDGYQSDTKTVTVTVNSVEATIVSAIRSVYDIIKKLFNW